MAGAEPVFDTRFPQPPAPQVIARSDGGSCRKTLQRRPVLQSPEMLGFALEGIALDGVVEVHRPCTGRSQDLYAVRKCPMRRHCLLRSPVEDVLEQGLVEQTCMLPFSARASPCHKATQSEQLVPEARLRGQSPQLFARRTKQPQRQYRTGAGGSHERQHQPGIVIGAAPREQLRIGIPKRESSSSPDLGIGVFVHEVGEHPHHKPVALCRRDDLLPPRLRDAALFKIPDHFLRWSRIKKVRIGGCLRQFSVRPRGDNQAQGLEVGHGIQRIHHRIASASCNAFEPINHDAHPRFRREPSEWSDHLPFQAPQPLLLGVRSFPCERQLCFCEPWHGSHQLLGKKPRQFL